MALTFFIVAAWFSGLCFACLPRKLPAIVNVLLYFGIAIVDINKFTILGYRLQVFEVSKEVPGFLSAVIHRDITFSITMVAYANAYLTAETRKTKIIATVCTFFFIFSTGQALRLFKVLSYKKWGIPQEIILISIIMIISLLLARIFQALGTREEHQHGQRDL